MAADDGSILTSIWIDATPAQVFPYFTDPDRLTQWLGHAADTNPVVGGRFAVDVNHRLVRGTYIEIDAPHRVVFTWGDAGSTTLPPGTTRVEVDLEQIGHQTQVTLRHHGLVGDARTDHALGWPHKLRKLVPAVGTVHQRTPLPRST